MISYNLNGSGVVNSYNWGTNIGAARSLILTGGIIHTWKDGSGNVCGGNLYYRVYKQGAAAGSFSFAIGLGFSANQGFTTTATPSNVSGPNGGDQRWQNSAQSIDLISLANSEGTWVLEVYFDASMNVSSTGACNSTQYYNNGGANYKILFDVVRNPGFEASTAFPPVGWIEASGWGSIDAASTVGVNPANVRSGNNSLFLRVNTGNVRILRQNFYNIVTPATGNNYVHVLGWVKDVDACTTCPDQAAVGSFSPDGGTSSTGTLSATTVNSYVRYTSSQLATNGKTYVPEFRIQGSFSSGGDDYYLDDIIIYTTTLSSGADITKPNAPSNLLVTRSGSNNNLTWTGGTDQATNTSGIDGTLILRASGNKVSSITALGTALRDQAYYSTISTIGPNVVSDGTNTWTVVANGSDVSSFSDIGAAADVTYLIFTRDKAYNYSATGVAVYANCSVNTWVGAISTNWHTAGNWSCGAVPTSSTDVVIPSGTTYSPNIFTADGYAKTLTINASALLTVSSNYTLFLSNTGGFINNGSFTAQSNSTVAFLGSGTLGGSIASTFNQLTLNGGLTVNTIPTVIGMLTMNANSYFATSNSVKYGSSSLLKYNINGYYGRGFEWNQSSGTIGVTAGYPNDIQISNNTILDFPNTNAGAFSSTIALAKDLTVDAGSNLYMDYGGELNKSGSLLVGRNVNVNGAISLGNAFGGDLRIGGNYTIGSAGFVTNNGRAVIFQGAIGDQIVTKVGGGIIYFDFLVVNKAAGNVQFTANTNATIISSVNNDTNIRILQLLSGGIDMNDGIFALQGDNQNSMNILVSGGVRRIFTSTGTGDFNIGGSNSSGIPKLSVVSQSGGKLLFDNNVVVSTTVGVDFGPSGITTVNAILRIDANGYVINNSPDYGASSTLIYNNGSGGYKRNLEWNTNNPGATGAGYPNNIIVQNNTPLQLNSIDFPANFPLGCSGNFTVQLGSSVTTAAMSYPIAIAGNLTIDGSLVLSTHPGGLLDVGGSWVRNGTFIQNDRNVNFNGSLNGSITALGGQTFSFMTMNKASKSITLSIDEHVAITDSIGLTQGTLVLNGRGISIVSTASKTARIGVSNKDNTMLLYSGGSIGSFFVQRYLPARRSWRLLAAPFINAGSISEAWQEGNAFDYGTAASTTSSNASDTTAASFATQITGGAIADGFDRGFTNYASIKYFDGINWIAPLNTNNTGVKSKEGWMLFVRGDRKNFGQITNQFKTPTPTTLRPRGRINIGDKVINGSGLTLVGNPYASAIDFTTLTKTGTLSGVNNYTVWDPYLGGALGVGAFVSFTWNGSSFVKSNLASTFDDRYIPSGAAVMVDFGAGGTLTFKESDKRAGNTTTAFRPAANQMNALLYTVNSDSTQYVSDGTTVLFGQHFSALVDNGDVLKVSNFSENISITTQSKFLSIARTKIQRNKDTVYFAIRNMKLKNYRFNLSLNDIAAPGGMAAFFEDVFMNRKISIRMNDSLNYYFSVTTDSGSYASNRFRLVFRPYAQFLQATARAVNADIQIGWRVGEEFDIDRYDIERSNDAVSFVSIGNLLPLNNNNGSASYNFIDVQPAAGTYYYRIRSRSMNGTIGYSNVIKIAKGRTPDEMYVFPNPVSNHLLQIRMPNYTSGIYSFKLLTQDGQMLMENSFQYYSSKGIAQSIKLNEQITAGVYNLVITRPDNKKETLKVVVE